MRLLKLFLATILLSLIIFSTETLMASDESTIGTVVYIDEQGCPECSLIREFNLVEKLENDGLTVIVYDIHQDTEIALAYNFIYGFGNRASSGVVFAGNQAFRGYSEIRHAYENGLIQEAAQQPLLDVSGFDPDAIDLFVGWRGVFEAVTIGLLDGINPCAIAMLLMFISIIGFIKTKKIILLASISYISAIFLTYFLLGLAFIFFVNFATTQFTYARVILYGSFMLLAFVLFALTMYDSYVSRKQEYEKIKAQMPKIFKNFNKNIMERFTQTLKGEQRGVKFYVSVLVIPFVVGIIVALVEAVCTGTPYLFFLQRVQSHYSAGTGISTYEILLLVIFNLMFVMPLIIIATVAVITQSIVGVSDFVRQRLPIIKFATGIFFLIMAVYFLTLTLRYL